MTKTSYSIKAVLPCACATLDNAKYLYVNFIYNFMRPSFHMDRIHFIEGDTDSSYWAIAGDPDDIANYRQWFKNVIKDREFYNKFVYNWFPNPELGFADEKKLLGLAVEKEGNEMIAVSAKCYYLHAYNKKKDDYENITKAKGYSQKFTHLDRTNYEDAISPESKTTFRSNMLFKMIAPKGFDFRMEKQFQMKKVITPIHDKMRVLENNSCAPFIDGLKREDYLVISE
jgi:hypothetical protein